MVKNTFLLYFRMLLVMLVGLYTSRVVLQALGVDDYGIWSVVGGLVGLFTIFTTAISQSIVRFITVAKAQKDEDQDRRIFSTAVIMQLAFCLLVLILTETAGLWWLNNHLEFPPERHTAAFITLQCTAGILMLSLLSVPFNATIIAHERMGAFAWISIVEATLKLAVAILAKNTTSDKLTIYAFAMLAVAFITRSCYGIYCKRHFPETRGRLVFDGKLLKKMTAFAGWNTLGSGASLVNTQGVSILSNSFFGVGVNAARGVAAQVENIVRQFITNMLTAMNPRITKTYQTDKKYCYDLASRATKFSFAILLLLGLPLEFEAPALLRLWLGNVPDYAIIFTRLTLVFLAVDLAFNPLLTIIQADGRIKRYYIISSIIALSGFALSFIAFANKMPPQTSYIACALAYFIVDAYKLVEVKKLGDFKAGRILRPLAFRIIPATIISSIAPALCHFLMPQSIWRSVLIIVLCLVGTIICSITIILDKEEREYIWRKAGRFLPDRIYLKHYFRKALGRKLRLHNPPAFNDKIQWLKLHDRNPLYHTLVDKVKVKDYVAPIIGEEHIIPNIAVWDRPEDIEWDKLPDKFVLKCNHDSGSVIVCRDKSTFDKKDAIRRLKKAMSRDFYTEFREWAYKGIKPRILAEEFISEDIIDYKFFCFGGKCAYLYISLGLEDHSTARIGFLSTDWKEIGLHRSDYADFDTLPPVPEKLPQMIQMAEKLAAGLRFVRVDLYCVEGKVYFSELTFYPNGGCLPFRNMEEDIFAGKFLEI